METSKQDLNYISNTLENYYYLKRLEKRINQEILELDMKIENERIAVKGMQYECNGVCGSGCSVNAAKPQSVNYLISKQVELSVRLNHIVKKYKLLDEIEQINYRLKRLSPESKIVINNYFVREMTLEDISKTDKVSKQTVSNRLEKALTEMANCGK